MKTSLFLYGCDPEEFADMPYREAIKYKIAAAKTTMHTVASQLDDMYKRGAVREEYQQSEYRLTKIKDSIEFNERLLNEIE